MSDEIDQDKQTFDETPEGWAKRWSVEFSAARKSLERWHKQAERVVKRFLDERDTEDDEYTKASRWNVFSANIQTMRAMLYGQTPKVSVTRKYADANDDDARVAAELLERVLNCDIQRDGDNYSSAIAYALDDRLLCGFGSCRVRYTVDAKDEQVEAKTDDEGNELAPGYTKSVKSYEDVETDYVFWRDELWNQARTYHEVRWRAWRAEVSRTKFSKLFGESVAKLVPANSKDGIQKDERDDESRNTPWSRISYWEIWSKEHSKRFFYVEGYPRIIKVDDDPFELEGFFPSPRPMFANVTTTKLVPKPDFALVQDLYNELDDVSTRIRDLQEAIKVAGAYDSSQEALRDIVKQRGNQLVPVTNWGMFAERGGLKGVIDWFPLDMVATALDKLREYRTELMGALYQLTGMSDIMRGQAQQTDVTATEQSLKAKFASIRMQALQDEFARYASELQNIRAQIIAKFFDPETILSRANAANMYDADVAARAIQLIKSDVSCYRIEVKPEAVSMTDFAQLKAERTEMLLAISGFFQNAAPLVQAMPGSLPFLLEILKWTVSGLRGSSEIEGVLDKAIQQVNMAQQQQAANPQVQQPDPKVQAIQLKAQADIQKTQADLQAHLIGIQAETQANFQRQRDQTAWNVREQEMRARIKRANDPGPAPAFSEPDMGGQQ